ncbi:hypothetical protein TWF751_003883 [Orbilia oligospora]|nr:hypothetical protein TWF751_003883 [Orbilia oligospora]
MSHAPVVTNNQADVLVRCPVRRSRQEGRPEGMNCRKIWTGETSINQSINQSSKQAKKRGPRGTLSPFTAVEEKVVDEWKDVSAKSTSWFLSAPQGEGQFINPEANGNKIFWG